MAAPIKWLRLYDDLLDDPKVQRLDPVLFKAWINLLCLANKGEPRGVLPPLSDMAFRFRVSEEEMQAILDALAQAGLVDEADGQQVPHNWGERQKPSDDVNSKMEKWRAGQKEATLQHNGQVTSRGNKSVTLPETEPRTLLNSTDARVDGESEAEAFSTKKQSRAEKDRECERKKESADAPPARPPFVVNDDSAPPPARPAAVVPLSLREEAAGLLTEADIADLLNSAPNEPRGSPKWTQAEIREGIHILRERKERPSKPRAYLHSAILPDVRNGKRANAPPVANSPRKARKPSPEPEETDEEFKRRKAAEFAALRKKREQEGVHLELPPLPP